MPFEATDGGDGSLPVGIGPRPCCNPSFVIWPSPKPPPPPAIKIGSGSLLALSYNHLKKCIKFA